MASEALIFLRDLADVEPPRDRYSHYDEEDIYRLVPRPQWTGLEDEIWTPRSQEHDPQLEKVKAMMKRNAAGGEGQQESAVNQLSASKFATKLARKKRKNPRVKVRMFLNNRFIDGLINLLILWALFMEDIRVLALPKKADVPIWYIHIFVMVVFCIEIMLRSYSQRGYILSFYFYLDILATGTIFIDFLPLMQSSGEEGGDTDVSSSTDAFRAARSARVGTRIARLVRVLRIIRVIKLFLSQRKKNTGKDDENDAPADEGNPSELSKALQGQIAKKTIVFVLVLLAGSVGIEFFPYAGVDVAYLSDDGSDRMRMGMSQFHAATYNHSNTSVMGEPFLSMRLRLRDLLQSPQALDSVYPPDVPNAIYKMGIYSFGPAKENYTFWLVPTKGEGNPYDPLSLRGTNDYYADPADFPNLPADEGVRMQTWVPAWPKPDGHWDDCEFRYLSHDYIDSSDVLLCPNAKGPTKRMRDLRIEGPPEIMRLPFVVRDPATGEVTTVLEVWFDKKVAEDVQAAMAIMLIVCITILLGGMGYLLAKDVDALVIRPIESMVDSVTKLAANPAHQLEKVTRVRYETDALKMSLSKIATMLQVGFGEAGNNLVAENLKKGDTVDPMVPGRKLLGAYGFCIIDEYEEVLECLGEEILPFTNTAATIVHDAVTDNGGQPNRNLGEAFLCVWKPSLSEDDAYSPQMQMASETKMCDGALTAFRRCVRGIATSETLQAYNQHEEIVKFFDGSYSTRIGYGLHYGWAIEGAVGTNIKIDCSYLSPNVNLAARLESATKMYGVNILMSQSFQSKLSPAMRKGLRRVDVVCLKGSSIPMAIYTCDRSNALYVSQKAIDQYGPEHVVTEFHKVFEEGMDEFVHGNWQASKLFFEMALSICPRDKPSQRILMHMDTPENHPDYGLATTPFVAPEGWPGYHILLSK